MRIIAGEKRGLLLQMMSGEDTRPTMEQVKEGLFSSIHFLLPGAKVLDLFSGSGQLGLEALSRGAVHCTFVDSSREAVSLIKENARTTGLFGKSEILCMDASAFLARTQKVFDIILLDPPYEKNMAPQLLQQISRVAVPGAVVLCETERRAVLPENVGDSLVLKKTYRYGSVLVSRYEKPQAQES